MPRSAWAGHPEREFAVIVLFSGHMVDRPGRPRERFPPRSVDAVRARLRHELSQFEGPALAVCGGACGGDLIFASEALRLGFQLLVCLSHDRAAFVDRSAGFAGPAWAELFEQVCGHERTEVEVIAPPPPGENRYEFCNWWMLERALSARLRPLHLILLWDQERGDALGGTAHMAEIASGQADSVVNLDLRTLARPSRPDPG